jgi:hypothetical protein
MVFEFGHQNLVVVSAGMRGGMWRHREACVEAKESHGEHVAIRYTYHKLDHFTPLLVVLPKYLRVCWECVISL